MHKLMPEPEWLDNNIKLENEIEITFWCKMLNCKKEDLIYAISRIGHSPRQVKFFLELNRLND